MIYLVSDSIDVSGLDWVKSISVEESKSMILKWPVVQFDTETTGLDPHVCKLLSLQFGYKDFKTGSHDEIVVDCTSIAPERYKSVIENSSLIGHNLKFDLEFLYNHIEGIVREPVLILFAILLKVSKPFYAGLFHKVLIGLFKDNGPVLIELSVVHLLQIAAKIQAVNIIPVKKPFLY